MKPYSILDLYVTVYHFSIRRRTQDVQRQSEIVMNVFPPKQSLPDEPARAPLCMLYPFGSPPLLAMQLSALTPMWPDRTAHIWARVFEAPATLLAQPMAISVRHADPPTLILMASRSAFLSSDHIVEAMAQPAFAPDDGQSVLSQGFAPRM